MTPAARRHLRLLIAIVALVFGVLLLWHQIASAESYLNVKGGVNVPGDFADFHAEYGMQGRQFEDNLKMQTGFAYGGTVGYCPKAADWLCLELEALRSWPNARQQQFVQFSRQPGGSWLQNTGVLAGGHWRMFTVGPNLILRHRTGNFGEGHWLFYAGGGSPIFMGNYSGDRQNPSFGFNAEAGMKYDATEDGCWRLLFEAHYMRDRGTYKEQDGLFPNGFTGVYQTTLILFGIERAFGK